MLVYSHQGEKLSQVIYFFKLLEFAKDIFMEYMANMFYVLLRRNFHFFFIIIRFHISLDDILCMLCRSVSLHLYPH